MLDQTKDNSIEEVLINFIKKLKFLKQHQAKSLIGQLKSGNVEEVLAYIKHYNEEALFKDNVYRKIQNKFWQFQKCIMRSCRFIQLASEPLNLIIYIDYHLNEVVYTEYVSKKGLRLSKFSSVDDAVYQVEKFIGLRTHNAL